MTYTATLIPGDGIGPEVTSAARKVLEATGVKFNWEVAEAGAGVIEKYGTPLPDSVINSIRKNKIALKGPATTPIGTGFRSINVALRKALDLYSCLRPCKTYPGVLSPTRTWTSSWSERIPKTYTPASNMKRGLPKQNNC